MKKLRPITWKEWEERKMKKLKEAKKLLKDGVIFNIDLEKDSDEINFAKSRGEKGHLPGGKLGYCFKDLDMDIINPWIETIGKDYFVNNNYYPILRMNEYGPATGLYSICFQNDDEYNEVKQGSLMFSSFRLGPSGTHNMDIEHIDPAFWPSQFVYNWYMQRKDYEIECSKKLLKNPFLQVYLKNGYALLEVIKPPKGKPEIFQNTVLTLIKEMKNANGKIPVGILSMVKLVVKSDFTTNEAATKQAFIPATLVKNQYDILNYGQIINVYKEYETRKSLIIEEIKKELQPQKLKELDKMYENNIKSHLKEWKLEKPKAIKKKGAKNE